MRRDFTINALMMDTQTGTILDFHQGMKDLDDKVIRHTSDKFSEDALRVYRAAQFASRFGFTVAPETLELCKKIDVTHLPQERIQEETYKAFTIDYNSAKPVVGVGICLDVYSTFNQQDVDWLNSITDRWEMYKYCISFSSTVESEEELEKLLAHCVEYF